MEFQSDPMFNLRPKGRTAKYLKEIPNTEVLADRDFGSVKFEIEKTRLYLKPVNLPIYIYPLIPSTLKDLAIALCGIALIAWGQAVASYVAMFLGAACFIYVLVFQFIKPAPSIQSKGTILLGTDYIQIQDKKYDLKSLNNLNFHITGYRNMTEDWPEDGQYEPGFGPIHDGMNNHLSFTHNHKKYKIWFFVESHLKYAQISEMTVHWESNGINGFNNSESRDLFSRNLNR